MNPYKLWQTITLLLLWGCGSATPDIKLVDYQLYGDHLFIAFDTLVYTQSWGQHGTGARDHKGYLTRVDLGTQQSEKFGPLPYHADQGRWNNVTYQGQLLLAEQPPPMDSTVHQDNLISNWRQTLLTTTQGISLSAPRRIQHFA